MPGGTSPSALRVSRTKKYTSAQWERSWTQKRKEILLDLVNLRVDSCAVFPRRFPDLDVSVLQSDDRVLLTYRDRLRQFWCGDDPAYYLAHWISRPAPYPTGTWAVTCWADGTYGISPNYSVLSLSLAIGASEWTGKMAICSNPNCPQPYFLRGRKTQRFCNRPACIAYGQREHKRNWWNEHGEHWRQKQLRTAKRGGKKKGGGQ